MSKTITHREVQGLPLDIETTIEEASHPWDGDEPLDPGCEGFDLAVTVALTRNGFRFEGYAQLGSVWAHTHHYVDDCLRDLECEAIADLRERIAFFAAGNGVVQAQREQAAAQSITVAK